MKHIIATDEAGYGPNLGPLVIGATRWKTEEPEVAFDDILSEFVFDQKSKLVEYERQTGSPGLMIADSKAVYKSGKIELLERGVLASLTAIHGSVPKNVGELIALFGLNSNPVQDSEYFQCNETSLPIASDVSSIDLLGEKVNKALNVRRASIMQLGVATVFPKQFNDGIDTHGNKASCLTAESLSLIQTMMVATEPKPDDCFDIRCDKHGGRNRYAPSIEDHFGDSCVTTEVESRPCSRYSFRNGQATIEFNSKGESWLPIALASMCAKYVREIYMQQWNQFWNVHIPDLKPTKGYPVDAKRFKKDIASKQKQLGIPDENIWRIR